MPDYRFSTAATTDIRDIFVFGAEQFGRVQAEKYLASMQQTFGRLAHNPNIGRPAETVKTALRRHGFGTHVIFYRPAEYGILVLRVIHTSRLSGNLVDDLNL